METAVVNLRHARYDVYIGRGSPFGNPFRVGEHGDRKAVIDKYENWLRVRVKSDPLFGEQVESLRGKRLGCFCKPKACHGDVLVKILEETRHDRG